jgi:hypothetical protein
LKDTTADTIAALTARLEELERRVNELERGITRHVSHDADDIVWSTRYRDTCRNADASEIVFQGERFSFPSSQQQQLVFAAWRRMEAADMSLAPHEARAAVITTADDWRPSLVFRRHPAVGKIIHLGRGGSVRLGPPQNHDSVTDFSRTRRLGFRKNGRCKHNVA